MFDRLREMFGIKDTSSSYEINPQEVLTEFERLLEMDVVTVNQNETDVINDFGEIVERYDNIEAELQRARENIGDGDGISLLDLLDNDQFSRWQEDHKHTVEEIKSLNEDATELLNEINIDESRLDESRINESDQFSELAVFFEQLNNAYRVFTYTSNK